MEWLFLDERDWVAPIGEGFSEVGGHQGGYTCDAFEWRGSKGWNI